MYSVLAVDLDDTLLADDKTVSPRTVAALEAWQASGRRIVIATGRPPRSTRIIPPFLHGIPVDLLQRSLDRTAEQRPVSDGDSG